MKTRGFTMIELLAIITILSLILLISFPTLINITRNDKEREYNDLVDTLCKAGETYIYNNQQIYPELENIGSVFYVRIADLINDNLVNKSQKSPKTGEISGDFYNDKTNSGQGEGTYSYTKETGLKNIQ